MDGSSVHSSTLDATALSFVPPLEFSWTPSGMCSSFKNQSSCVWSSYQENCFQLFFNNIIFYVLTFCLIRFIMIRCYMISCFGVCCVTVWHSRPQFKRLINHHLCFVCFTNGIFHILIFKIFQMYSTFNNVVKPSLACYLSIRLYCCLTNLFLPYFLSLLVARPTWLLSSWIGQLTCLSKQHVHHLNSLSGLGLLQFVSNYH